MSDTRGVRGAKLIRKLRKLGRRRGIKVEIRSERGRGSHAMIFFGDRRTIIPDRKKELKKGTLHGILRQLDLTVDDLP